MANHFATQCAAIDAGEVFFHCRCEQRNVRDFAEMFGNEPDWFVRRHPVEMIESGKIYRARITAQRPFTAQIEINIEITHGQFAQGAVNRLAITAAGEVRFRYRAPMPTHFENGYDVIGVLLGFQIENQRWKSKHSERSCRKNSAL